MHMIMIMNSAQFVDVWAVIIFERPC